MEIHYDEQLQNIRGLDATSGTHGLGNITTIHDHNLNHQQLKLNEKTQQLGKNINKSKNNNRGFDIPTILNGKIEVKKFKNDTKQSET
jgi:hypothetical protein